MEARHKNGDAEKNCDDVWVSNDTSEEFWCELALEKIDAVREEGDIEGNNEATVWDNPLFTKGTGDDWIAEEGGVIKDEGKLRLKTEFALIETLVKDCTGQQDEYKHHEDAGK